VAVGQLFYTSQGDAWVRIHEINGESQNYNAVCVHDNDEDDGFVGLGVASIWDDDKACEVDDYGS
jgi:hypothetical protein